MTGDITYPAPLHAILRDSEAIGFTLASEPATGALLRTLAASKPGGRFLELGTGTGVGTAWMLDGMDAVSHLHSVDSDATVQNVARRHLSHDARVTFYTTDGAEFMRRQPYRSYDFVFADAWPGKFEHLDVALDLVASGGVYFVDDLLPQPTWPEGHQPKVDALIRELQSREEFVSTTLAWASGLMILVRVR